MFRCAKRFRWYHPFIDFYVVQVLFTHPQDHYDVLVELDSSELPRYSQNIHADPNVWARKGKYANVQQSQDTVQPGFDPARLLFDDLTVSFPSHVRGDTSPTSSRSVYTQTPSRSSMIATGDIVSESFGSPH